MSITTLSTIPTKLTGKDPVTGKPVSRVQAALGLGFDVASYAFAFAKLGKVAKAGIAATKASTTVKTVDAIDGINDAAKTAYNQAKNWVSTKVRVFYSYY